ncbi:MAG: hypothetical protein ACRCX2_39230, partial [Paraclostridium sp.]
MSKKYADQRVSYGNSSNDPYRTDSSDMSLVDEIIRNTGVVMDEQYARRLDFNQHKIHDAYLASNVAVQHRTFTFFVKPDLNIMENEHDINPNAKKYSELYNVTRLYKDIALQLCVSANPHDRLIPLLSNHIRELSPIEVTEDGRDGVKNMYGKSMFLPGVFDFM